jgi:Inner membrane component domain
VIWFLIAGWWLTILHIVTGVVLCLTIIGIPLGLAFRPRDRRLPLACEAAAPDPLLLSSMSAVSRRRPVSEVASIRREAAVLTCALARRPQRA